jgi:hypothetical protein
MEQPHVLPLAVPMVGTWACPDRFLLNENGKVSKYILLGTILKMGARRTRAMVYLLDILTQLVYINRKLSRTLLHGPGAPTWVTEASIGSQPYSPNRLT